MLLLVGGELLGAGPPSDGSIKIGLSAAPTLSGELPEDRSDGLFKEQGELTGRPIYHLVPWEAADLAHHPLYFEDEAVERNGQYRPLVQPALSAAHFFGRIPALPYLMASQAPQSCVYPLGAVRPGSCVEPYYRQWPKTTAGGVAEAGVMTGLFFLIP